MVVNYLHILGALRSPHKANSPLIVNANAVLTLPISFQSLELVARRRAQVIKNRRPIKLLQLSKRRTLDIDPATYTSALKEGLRILALEALYRHASIVTPLVHNVKRYYAALPARWSRHNGRFVRPNRDRKKPHGPPSHTTGHTGHVSGGSLKLRCAHAALARASSGSPI